MGSRERWQRYKATHAEEIKASRHRYYLANKEKILEKNRRYNDKHHDKRLAWQREYRRKHPEKCAEITTEWWSAAQELTADGAMHYVRWDYTDDLVLMTSRKTLLEIAHDLGRTYSSCANRRYVLKKAGWTP